MSSAAPLVPNEPHREAVYDPFENDMGEGSLQRFISELLRPQVEDHLAALREPTFVGADQYVGWDPDDAEKVLSPDVYVLPGVEPGKDFEFWKVWQTGIVPSFALEIVSTRKKKDYKTVLPLYGELGVALAEAVLTLYAVRFGAPPSDVATLVERTRDQAVLLGWLRVMSAGSAVEVAALFHEEAR
jgi:Putative restriction endonuclease